MSRFAPLLIVCFTILVGATLWFANPFEASQNSTAHSHEQSDKKQSDDPNDSSSAGETSSEVQKEDSAEPQAQPKAVTESTLHDFGIKPRFTKGSHTFEIHNEGDAPLELEQGPSSCSCTLLGLEQSTIPPGGSASIELDWDLKFKSGPFLQNAVVYTNDPDRKEIAFEVKGLIETRLGLTDDNVTFTALSSDGPQMKEVLLYSKTWQDLKDVQYEIKADIPGMKVDFLPTTDEERKSVKARSARKVRIEVPSELESGYHVGQVEITAKPSQSESSEAPSTEDSEQSLGETVSLNVSFNVKSPGAKFFSTLIDGYGVITLGRIDSAKGSELLKINFRVDRLTPAWSVSSVETYPEFVKASVISLDEEIGLYQLQIQIPPGAKPGNYYSEYAGGVRIKSDHPQLPQVPSRESGIILKFHID